MFNFITSRRLSLVIVLGYGTLVLVAGLVSNQSARQAVGSLLVTLMYFLVPLACIWFEDEMGHYMGRLPGPGINRPSPGWMVKFAGWFLLLLPAVIVVFGSLLS